MLFDLAGAAGLEDKRTKMGTGQHINATEDRAGKHQKLFPAQVSNKEPKLIFCDSSVCSDAHCPAIS